MPDGTERPIAFCSRTLSKAETNYSQLDREATAIFWAVKKFFIYLFGRKFTLVTDNKPLSAIFHPNAKMPEMSAARLLRYAQFLSNFNYEVVHRKGELHQNADFTSRFPLPLNEDVKYEIESFITIAQLQQIELLPITREDIVRETAKDSTLRPVFNALQTGSGLATTEFQGKDSELSLENGCIFRGVRVVVPKILQSAVMEELHNGHIGASKMKALARQYVYWKNIDHDIEVFVKNCSGCKQVRKMPPKTNNHPWIYPETPWHRVHLDFAGPFMNTYFLLIVDAHSKWLEVFQMYAITTSKTIKILREVFARFGLPATIVTDNGTQFTSGEFAEFIRANGIQHKYSAPYHPSTNGQVERYVQVVKNGLKAMANETGDLDQKLANLLMQHRKTPHPLTGASPAELMLKCAFRTRIDLIKIDKPAIIREKQLESVIPPERVFEVNQPISHRVYGTNEKWANGTVIEKEGPLNYKVIDEQGNIQRRHADQIIASSKNVLTTVEKDRTPNSVEKSPSAIENAEIPASSGNILGSPRRSTRNRKPPNSLDL